MRLFVYCCLSVFVECVMLLLLLLMMMIKMMMMVMEMVDKVDGRETGFVWEEHTLWGGDAAVEGTHQGLSLRRSRRHLQIFLLCICLVL